MKEIKTEHFSVCETSDSKMVSIKINVPLRIKDWADKTSEAQKDYAVQNLRMNASVLFEHIQLLSRLPDELEIDLNKHREAFMTLAFIGEGLLEAMEAVENDFERFTGKPKDENEPKDDLAARLSEILKDERLPAPVYSAIMHGFDDINNSLNKTVLQNIEEQTDYIRETFSMYEKQNENS